MSSLKRDLKIDLVVQGLPPLEDAIGEYSHCLASNLSANQRVRVLVPEGVAYSPIEKVEILPSFRLCGRNRFDGLQRQLLNTDSEIILLQYNPFSWGRRGWAPDLVRLFRKVRQSRRDLVISVMFHEIFTMRPSWRGWLLRSFQYRQYRALCNLADILFFSTELWAESCRRSIADRPAIHLPVGSNLPPSNMDRDAIREILGIPRGVFVCGVFGGSHPSRLISKIESAVHSISQRMGRSEDIQFLHIGGVPINFSLGKVAANATGRLEAQEASNAVASLDLMINPFSDGVSTRRGSVIAALQNGVPVLTTQGRHTDRIWFESSSNGVFMADVGSETSWLETTERAFNAVASSPEETRRQAMAFFDKYFTWDSITEKMVNAWSTKN